MNFNLGINSDSVKYEVALDILGQTMASLVSAIFKEKRTVTPSVAFLQYCEARLKAIDQLQDSLQLSDSATIEKILDQSSRAMWL